MDVYRGRLFDHVHLVVKDMKASRRFYKAILKTLDIPLGGESEDHLWADELYISSIDSPASAGSLTGRHHLALQAADRATVERFHKEGLAAGGRDNGKPGERNYHPGYFAAFLLDPDGNNIEAVYHGPENRTADAIKISFS